MDKWVNFKGLFFNRFCSPFLAVISHHSTPNHSTPSHTPIEYQKIDNYEATYSQGMAPISIGFG